MYKLLKNNDIPQDGWQELVNGSEVATFFQTPDCYKFYSSLSFLTPFAYAVEKEGKLLALLCGYLIADGGAIKRFFSRRAIVPGGFLLIDNCPTEAIELLIATTKRELSKKAIYIETRNYNDYNRYRSEIESFGFEYQEHLNFHVDTTDLEVAFKNISSTKRRDIKKSLKEGAEIVISKSRDEMLEYYNILNDLYTNKIKVPLFPFDFFEKLIEYPFAKLILIKYNGKIIGGEICVLLKDRTLFEWFACGKDGEIKNIFPTTLATWGAIEYAASNNVQKFDMMGAGKPTEGYGVRDFKSRFGGELVEHGRFIHICNPLLFKIGKQAIKLLKRK